MTIVKIITIAGSKNRYDQVKEEEGTNFIAVE